MKEVMTTEEAAELLGISARTLEAMRARGHGPRFIRVGRLVRYTKSDMEAYLKEKAKCTSDYTDPL